MPGPSKPLPLLRGAAIARYHQQRLMDIAAFARQASAFYATRLDGFLAISAFDPARWRDVPLLLRGELEQAGEALLVSPSRFPADAGTVRINFTSGTVGRPMRVAINRLADVFSQLKYRAYFADWDISTARNVLTVRQPRKHEQQHRGEVVAKSIPGAPGREFTLFSLEPDKVLAAAAQYRPNYLRAYPTLVHAAAVEALRRGVEVTFDRIMTVGETLHEDVRAFVEATFRTRIADAYAAEEFGLVAYLCPHCGQYHCNNEGLYVELVDDRGAPVRVGETGRVAITCLYGYAMPLIRYVLGDYATRAAPHGRCADRGLTFVRIEGRERNLFRLPDGGRIWPVLSATSLYELGIDEIEVTQLDLRTIEVRYRAADSLKPGAITELVRNSISPQFDVIEKRVGRLDTAPSGKRAVYLSRVPPA